MIIRKVSNGDLDKALKIVNKKYDGNVIFNRFDPEGSGYRITLKVLSSKKPGHRLGFTRNKDGNRRKLASACWHVHGDFFDAILKVNPDSEITVSSPDGTRKIYKGSDGDTYGNWEDRNIGSLYEPLYFSEACECNPLDVI